MRHVQCSFAAAVLTVGGVLVGCSPGQHATSHSADPVVAWVGQPVSQVATRPAASAPDCTAAQLRVLGRGLELTPYGSGGTGTITLSNKGSRACRLTGRPAVAIVGAADAPRQRQVNLPPAPATFPDVVPPASALLALPPGDSATLSVQWSNWCPPHASPGKRVVPPRAVRVTLPGGRGSVDVDYNAVPDCVRPAEPSKIGVTPFAPAPLPPAPPWTTANVTATIQPADQGLRQVAARRGEIARYRVTLHNNSAYPVPFTGCPLFVEAVEPAGTPQAYRLNCSGVAALAPKASRTFEMRVVVPADAPLGSNGLLWELDPTGAQEPEAVSHIQVLP